MWSARSLALKVDAPLHHDRLEAGWDVEGPDAVAFRRGRGGSYHAPINAPLDLKVAHGFGAQAHGGAFTEGTQDGCLEVIGQAREVGRYGLHLDGGRCFGDAKEGAPLPSCVPWWIAA